VATLLFPEEGTDEKRVREVFRQIQHACRRFHVSLIGGHTEVTPGINRVLLSGTMIGEVPKEKLVTTGGARAGDALVLIKGICIEGTSVIARENEKDLLRRGISLSLIQRAKRYLHHPGLDVLRASRIAGEAVSVHAMHDPTEGGLINGIVEMAIASEKEMEVDLQKVPVYKESRVLCETYGLNPFRVLSSGALLLTVSSRVLESLVKAFRKASIPMEVIGKVRRGPSRVLAKEAGRIRELKAVARDDLLNIFERGDVT
jgi:hydrogenase maturation factor